MEDFESQVVHAVYRAVRGPALGAENALVPEIYDNVQNALIEFYARYARDPELFPTVTDAVHWVFRVVGNMNRWAGTNQTIAIAEWDVIDEVSFLDEETPELDPVSLGAASVIMEYFADSEHRHGGRLTLTVEEVGVLSAAAQYGLSDASTTIASADYQLIAEIIDRPIDWIQETLYNARAAFAEIFYLVGGLGPDGAFASVEALDQALEAFWGNFRGQNAWSVLKYAARSAFPEADFAQVDPAAYTKAILAQYEARQSQASKRAPDQAERLGWEPGGPPPPELLHVHETRAAEAFGQPHPHCVVRGCQLHGGGSQ